MKFTGQIKIPDLDHPGVPAVVLIEGNQTELLVQGESLGRWSLVDVRADRLIANAFSLALGGEEVTFIADEPVDFAYRGVEEMANVWARYRTMTLPRRLIANRRSRSGTTPSRITELRSAMADNLAVGVTARAGTEEPQIQKPTQVSPAVAAPRSQPPPPPPAAEPSEVLGDREPQQAPAAPHRERSQPAEIPAARSGFDIEGTTPERDITGPDLADPSAKRQPDFPVESVFKENVPWLTPGSTTSDHAEDVPETGLRQDAATFGDGSFAPPQEAQPIAGGPEEEGDDPGAYIARSAAFEADVLPPRPALRDPPAKTPMRYVVDLGAFENSDHDDHPDHGDALQQAIPEPALAAVGDKGGIMGAVRAAFVRGRPQHDHEYVAAPGGIGIVRHICTECGHISIGTTD